jgi:hypothetical protein
MKQMPNIPLQPIVKKLRFLPSAELARYAAPKKQGTSHGFTKN